MVKREREPQKSCLYCRHCEKDHTREEPCMTCTNEVYTKHLKYSKFEPQPRSDPISPPDPLEG